MAGISIHRVKSVTARLATQFDDLEPCAWVELFFHQDAHAPVTLTVFTDGIDEARRLADCINGAPAAPSYEDRRVPRYPEAAE